jgi:hypothetical protein
MTGGKKSNKNTKAKQAKLTDEADARVLVKISFKNASVLVFTIYYVILCNFMYFFKLRNFTWNYGKLPN